MSKQPTVSNVWPLKTWLIRCALALACLVLAATGPAHSAPENRDHEYAVKAGFIFNFLKFVTWPAEQGATNGPLTIGITERNPLAPVLEKVLDGKNIGSRPLQVRVFGSDADLPKGIQQCQVLVLDNTEEEDVQRVLAPIGSTAILTIGDMPAFCRRGGIINFVRTQNTVHFEINVAAAKRARLTISSNLLKLAKVLNDDQEPSP